MAGHGVWGEWVGAVLISVTFFGACHFDSRFFLLGIAVCFDRRFCFALNGVERRRSSKASAYLANARWRKIVENGCSSLI